MMPKGDPCGIEPAGASCGVAALLPLDQPDEVLERADRAMYARKAARCALWRNAGSLL
jgi:PleD family two-component response regulator